MGKYASRREDGRHGDGRPGKSATDCRANDRTDRPNEGHHCKRSCCSVLSAKIMSWLM